MIDKLLREIEELVGSDDFIYAMEEKMSLIKDEGAGIETVTPLLQIMERHPLDDFGMPGAMVHFIETFYPSYEPYLIESLKRRPTLHTVWMFNRCINATSKKDEYLSLMKEIVNREDIEKEIRNSAQEFVDFQFSKN
ncbi:MAG: hypothetical protein J1F28_00640 [Oscillospiraceae bacterium]|nr:hypothetical protein [Oscillospiraceae bacterium]